MKKLLLVILLLLIVIFIGLVINTLLFPFTKTKKSDAQAFQPISNDSILSRLAGGIKIPSVSNGDPNLFVYAPFDTFKQYIAASYPLIHQQLEVYTVHSYGLVFKLKGSNSNLLPLLFLSHYDVVPPGSAEIKNKSEHVFQPSDKPLPPISTIAEVWDYAPFSGAVADGRIYGRGTLDMKGMLFSLLEAMQKILLDKERPQRDIYLAFGFDEEVGGELGASKIAAEFKRKGLRFEAVYDEGGLILKKGSVKGIHSDVALIGCAEKGFLSLKIKVKGLGGHSSMPPSETAIGKAAVIMQRLEAQQMKPMISPLIQRFFQQIGGSMPFVSRFAIANRWLMEPHVTCSVN